MNSNIELTKANIYPITIFLLKIVSVSNLEFNLLSILFSRRMKIIDKLSLPCITEICVQSG